MSTSGPPSAEPAAHLHTHSNTTHPRHTCTGWNFRAKAHPTMTTTTKRTGASLVQTAATASTHTMLTVGFTPEQAARMMAVRRVLPFGVDRRTPCIDARKLWARIGRPYGRFNAWADTYIKPLESRHGTGNPFAEISVKVQATRGRPRVDYDLSRDIAAQLAMMANTAEGADIRAYFLDMEELALKLAHHCGIRAHAIVSTDNAVTHMFRRSAGDDAKAGKHSRALVPVVALDRERLLKATVCEVVTERPTAYWKDTHGRSVRDVLDTADLLVYSQCYETARAMVAGGMRSRDKLCTALRKSYGGCVDVAKYESQQQGATQ